MGDDAVGVSRRPRGWPWGRPRWLAIWDRAAFVLCCLWSVNWLLWAALSAYRWGNLERELGFGLVGSVVSTLLLAVLLFGVPRALRWALRFVSAVLRWVVSAGSVDAKPSSSGSSRCPFCRTDCQGSTVDVECPGCRARIHPECWTEAGSTCPSCRWSRHAPEARELA